VFSLKDVYKKLLLEMLANSKRSDRELAKVLHVSQPTITRARNWLEKSNFIREYTVMPDFSKIGLELVAFTFFKLTVGSTKEKYDEVRKKANSFLAEHSNIVMALRGEGMMCDGIIVTLHRDFAEFTHFIRELKTKTVDTEVVGNFLASLQDGDQYRDLTFRFIKEYIDK
jgi:DNA-binding Lrp family transcriptional regulator